MVIGEQALVTETIDSIRLTPLGPTPLKARIDVDGQPYELRVAAGRSVDLLSVTKIGHAKQINITVSIGSRRRSSSIYVGSAPSFDTEPIDIEVGRQMGRLAREEEPDISSLLLLASQRHGSLLGRYAEGFAEYLIGCRVEELDGDWASAARRYERAQYLLRVFGSHLAIVVTAALDFRMNSFRRIVAVGRATPFWPAGHFYLGLPVPVGGRTDAIGVWIPDEQERLLRGVALYAQGEFQSVSAELASSMNLRDPLSESKLWFLIGMSALRLGDVQLSRHALDRVLDDPHLGALARESLDGSREE
jgi:hypothetical protein